MNSLKTKNTDNHTINSVLISAIKRFVGMTGFEPATPRPPGVYATGLRYIPNPICKNNKIQTIYNALFVKIKKILFRLLSFLNYILQQCCDLILVDSLLYSKIVRIVLCLSSISKRSCIVDCLIFDHSYLVTHNHRTEIGSITCIYGMEPRTCNVL
jgi:hypothetical protein